jgi:signal transduction histidine kinase/CheY-like chemotaxis protein
MSKVKPGSDDALRRMKAEELLKSKTPETRQQHSETELLKLLHELEVHQIELEMQNEELQLAKTDAREAAEKYTGLFDFAPIGYAALSRDGVIDEINLVGAAMLGRDRSRVINKQLGIFVSSSTREMYTAFLENIYSSGVQESCELILAGDNDQSMNVFTTGIVSDSSERCMITMVDITDRKRIAKELVAAKEKAMESDRLKSAFLANMSHEIRTPMNGILGFTWLLKQPMLSNEQKQEYISIIEQSGLRMLHIINDILSIARVEAGQVELSISGTDINSHFDYIQSFFEPEARRKGIQLIAEKGLSAEEVTVLTDSEKLFSILSNLTKNAIKFTADGSITLAYEKKGEFLEISVKDTGEGMRRDKQEIIFERFRQDSESLTRDNDGSGLGLSIARAYVELLGGRIWVKSEYGKGSEFYFTIPRNLESFEDTASRENPTAAEEEAKIRKLKILVAEDDEISDLYLTIAIKDISRDVLKVTTGYDAVEVCRKNPDIELILMDIRMLVMDGYAATTKIREFNKDVIIIAQSAQALSGEKEMALKAGCNDYISKPIDPSSLMNMIRKYFGSESVN